MQYMGRLAREERDSIGRCFRRIKAHERFYVAAEKYNAGTGERPDEAAVRAAITEIEEADYELKVMKPNDYRELRRIKSSRIVAAMYINQLKRSINALPGFS